MPRFPLSTAVPGGYSRAVASLSPVLDPVYHAHGARDVLGFFILFPSIILLMFGSFWVGVDTQPGSLLGATLGISYQGWDLGSELWGISFGLGLVF